MKIFTMLSIMTLLGITTTFSQISVTSNSLKSWLGFQQIIESDTSGTVPVNLGSPGENQMWDFRNLPGETYKAVYEFFPAATTPYINEFPGANYAFKIDFTSDLFSGMMYQYVNLQDEEMQSLGNVVVSNGDIIQVDKDDDVTPLPLTFGKIWATTLKDTLEIPGLGMNITTIAETNTIDAWGTIKLPSGEYNCLRWKIEGTSVLSTKVGGVTIPIASYTYIDYTWIGENSLLLATVSSMDDETDPNYTTASGITWLSSVNASTDIADSPGRAPETFALLGNYPNPFNPNTTISFQLDKAQEISLGVYDVQGRVVQQLVSGAFDAGTHHITWNGTNARGELVAGGTYFYKLSSATESDVRKLTLLK